MKRKLYLETFGCQMNVLDSGGLLSQLRVAAANVEAAKINSFEPARGDQRGAGFCVRCAATILDMALVVAVVAMAVAVLNGHGVYAQPEVVFAVAGMVYSASMVKWRGATVGKILCGLRVHRRDGRPLGLGRSLLRESVGKLFSAVPLFLGFLWIAFGKQKRGWHDWLADTCVSCSAPVRRTRVMAALTFIVAGSSVALHFRAPASSYLATQSMAVPSNLKLPADLRSTSAVTEVATLGEPDELRVAAWLDKNGTDPMDYLLEKARTHQVVILGEMHEQADTLRWFNRAIPLLHERAGVTCIAMEVCLAEDNPEIERLVTGETFDRTLAAELGRHQPYALWGWQEYWDVFETVWRINRTIPEGHRKLRVIGLDKPMDVPSIVMMGISDMPLSNLPPWEKLRAWRLPQVMALLLLRDGAMAEQVQREIIERDERGVVLVGAIHSTIGCRQSGRERWGSMGMMLHHRHADSVFQIRLHQMDLPRSSVDKAYHGPKPSMAGFLERVMARRGHKPVGFDVAASPLALLRDDAAFDYHGRPSAALCDLAMGYVYLKDWQKIEHCQWQRGYISDRMFTMHKPMYQALARLVGLYATNAADMDAVGETMGR